MKKTLLAITIAAAAVVMTGCMAQSVPRLTLSVNPKTHQVDLSNPKDTTVKGFKAVVNKDGSSTVVIESLTTVMNPDVITTTGEAQAKMISATAAGVAEAIKLAK